MPNDRQDLHSSSRRRSDVVSTTSASSAHQKQDTTPDSALPKTDALPAIELPTSGGAIRDIGEKFSINPVTGTASLTIPLALSPGRGGFTPQLQLSYDSGSGNGPFGFGWSISLPCITRRTDRGLPRYNDDEESDVFILAGSEDLVPVLDGTGSRAKTLRTVNGSDYEISTYRPRTEGIFSRIEHWVNSATGAGHWRTISRDNVSSLYGVDASGSVSNPADRTKVFRYELSRSWDDKGNVAVYDYAAEDSTAIDIAAAHERNRDAAGRSTQRYLKSVRYGNLQPYFPDWSVAGAETPVPTDWMFQVVFDYGDHSTQSPSPTADQPWPVRPDPFSVYRAGFEVRTYRRVHRVLYFHHFPNESSAGADVLVRSTDLVYSDQQTPADPRNPIYTFLVSVTAVGYGKGTQASMPPLTFRYSQPKIQADVESLDAASFENLPEGIDGSRFQWVDLNGEGTPGILSGWDGAWGYKPNLSPVNRIAQPDGSLRTSAEFGPLELVPSIPSRSTLDASLQWMSLAGDGRLELIDFRRPAAGFFKRTDHESWEPFEAFESWPDINWSDPNLKFVDLTGDGLADILVTEEGVFTLYPSLGEEGFAEALQVRTPWDEERGPKVVMADGTQTMFLADMTGDGMTDIVRLRNGEVCYWPNTGYGHFGAKVTMDNAPRFTDQERFDPTRFRLADVDGTGTADLVYVGPDGVQLCFNQSGNAWSAPNRIAVFPTADRESSVQVLDLLGTGTACLVWSSPLPHGRRPLFYVDLLGGQKPHLLTSVQNNLGAETRVTYAPSTRFYVADKLAGKPWVTRLSFPVQVVERVETFDWIGRNRHVTRFAYHHGYFDGYEREFRGFGRVEQWDTDEFRGDTLFSDGDAVNWDAQSWAPPVLTCSWYHTGAFIEAQSVSRQYEREYWVEPALGGLTPPPMLLPETVLPAGLDPFEMQEAYRALKGQPLRTEVYAVDSDGGTGNPYTVTERNFTVEILQHIGVNPHAVFFVHPREEITFHYEQNATDPRVTHAFTLEVDAFANVLRGVSVAYPRRPGYAPPELTLSVAAQSMLAYDQGRLHIQATQNSVTNAVDTSDAYRNPASAASMLAEITGATPAANVPGVTNLFTFDECNALWQTVWDGLHDIPYEQVPAADVDGSGVPAASPTRRILSRMQMLYRSDDLTTTLAAGVLESRGLTGNSYQLAFTPGLIENIYGTLISTATLTEGGYVQLPGDPVWWAPSGQTFYSSGDGDTTVQELAAAQAHFFRARRAVDPFGAISRIDYDSYDLLPVLGTDAVGNTHGAQNDYRVLKPVLITDPNGNRSQVKFDALGRVAGTAVMGKTTESLGDSLDLFQADLDDATVAAHMANPLAAPDAILGNATTRFVYDQNAFYRTGSAPAAGYLLTRETHVSDLAAGETTLYQHTLVYSDGFGREIQKKAPAPPTAQQATRWIGSGWSIFDNKGRTVRQYEPFFSLTSAFEFAAATGVSMVMLYDAPGRPLATLRPDNTWEKTVFDNWRQETWDTNDTVMIADPRSDPDVGPYFARLLGTEAFVSWHNARIGGEYGATADDQAAQMDAAKKAEAHAATPAVVYFDSLGRKCLVIADNGRGTRFPSRTAFDGQGKPLAVFDALGRRVLEHCLRMPSGGSFRYIAGMDVRGDSIFNNSMDGGARRGLSNAAGKSIRNWDARNNAFRQIYDPLQRLTHRYASINGAREILAERFVFGEALAAANLCTRLFRHYDAAGVAINQSYDFKGNLLATTRQLATDYHLSADWSAVANLTDAAQLDAAAAPLLSMVDSFSASTTYDALDRAIQIVTPHRASMKPNVLRPSFNESNQLDRMDAWLQQAAAPAGLLDPSTAGLHAITAVEYNARGQRLSITLGNGAATTYAYDPETFRLTQVTTDRGSEFAANQRVVQDLFFFFDPVANVTRIRDDADTQDVIYFNNQRIDPTADFTYDPTYELVQAKGREHLGQNAPPVQASNDDSFRMSLPQPGDGNAMATYTETYSYDPAGNLIAMLHQVSTGSWRRLYSYAEPSQIVATETCNRLSATSLPADPVGGPYSDIYTHDAHGNMTRMTHLPTMTWDEYDHLRSTSRQVRNGGAGITTFYVYSADGQRLRKVTDSQSGVRQVERVYLGPIELYREFSADGQTETLIRETLHVLEGQQRVALVETRIEGTDRGLAQLVRYQLTNHLDSAMLELDEQGRIISYEEYFPFGSTSYQAVRNQTDTPKRYRFTGKERDDENDFSYHGARYYAPWLGRWTACDPKSVADGLNLFAYVHNRPTTEHDPNGTEGEANPRNFGTFEEYQDAMQANTMMWREGYIEEQWQKASQETDRSTVVTRLKTVDPIAQEEQRARQQLEEDIRRVQNIQTPMLSFIMPAHVAPYLRDQSVGIQNPLLHFQAQVNQAAGQAAARFTNRVGMVAIGTYGLAMGAAYGGVMAVELAGPAIAAGGAQLASAYQTAGIYIAVNFPRLTAITMAIAGGMAGVSTSSGGTAPAQAAEEQASVWTLNAFVRGRVIERMLIALRGGNQVQLASNFPVIDTALEGAGPAAAEVVSIKSLDVGAASYQAAGSILSRLTNYVDKLAGFAGRSWAGVTVNVDPNTVRTLELAIPATGATPAQLQEIATAAQYAAQQGVNLVVRAVR